MLRSFRYTRCEPIGPAAPRGAGARTLLLALVAALLATGCSDPEPTLPPPPSGNGPGNGDPGDGGGRFVELLSGLASPVFLTAPAGDARLFVLEQGGRIRIVADGVVAPQPFLDITAHVRSGGERGLLGLAFHPLYEQNGIFFISYTDTGGNSRIERYRVSADPDRADAASGATVLTVAQPFANHNGGMIAFGPDGFLYIGLGDGGSGGDPQGHGQNPTTLLGSLLRIDVDGAPPYAIPPGNPFAGGGGRAEIWATGLRNPWRFSFDAAAGLLYIADVGQNRREEINVQPADAAGLNYGWNRMEGSLCFPAGSTCDPAGFVVPAVEYPNPQQGCSVTGGYVYRGTRVPSLRGHYLYADYCDGWVRSFHFDPASGVTAHRTVTTTGLGNIASFGEDGSGELYVVAHGGRIFQLLPGSD